ncbi:MAG: hypothetical protein ACK559_13725, partial [bacterium]
LAPAPRPFWRTTAREGVRHVRRVHHPRRGCGAACGRLHECGPFPTRPRPQGSGNGDDGHYS